MNKRKEFMAYCDDYDCDDCDYAPLGSVVNTGSKGGGGVKYLKKGSSIT